VCGSFMRWDLNDLMGLGGNQRMVST